MNGELRLENDRVKDEKIEALSQLNKQLETEKNQKRTFKQAAEKSSLRQRYLEEEMQQLKLNFEQKLHDFELLHKAKEDLLELDNRKDNQILTLQKRIQELETQIMNCKNTSQTQQMQIIQNEYEKTLAEKQKNEKLQNLYDNLNIDYQNLKLQKKHLEENTIKNYEKLQIDFQNLQKDENEAKKKYIQYKKENEKVIQQMEAKDNLIEELEKELNSVKNKYRTTITKFQQPATLTNQENQTIRKDENSQEKIKQLRLTNNKLKQKLKIANKKIIELLSRQIQSKGNLDGTLQNEDKYLEDVLQRNQIPKNQFSSTNQITNQYPPMQQNFNQQQIPRIIKTEDDILMNEIQNLIKEKQYYDKF